VSDVDQMIASLEQQKVAIDEAIQALRNVSAAPAPKRAGRPATKGVAKKKRRLSPEGRRHIVEALKRRWAAKRAAQKSAAKK